MNMTLAKLILGLEKVLDAEQINKAVSQRLRDKANRGNIAAKQAIIEARDFLFHAGFESDEDQQTSLPSFLQGWFRRDQVRHCSSSPKKQYLVTEFLNFETRKLFDDFPRKTTEKLPEHVLLIPEVERDAAPEKAHSGYTFGNNNYDCKQFEILYAGSEEGLIVYEYLDSSNILFACPHCQSTSQFYCVCGAVSCDSPKKKSAVCGKCSTSTIRTKLQPVKTLNRTGSGQAKIGQQYKHIQQPTKMIAN